MESIQVAFKEIENIGKFLLWNAKSCVRNFEFHKTGRLLHSWLYQLLIRIFSIGIISKFISDFWTLIFIDKRFHLEFDISFLGKFLGIEQHICDNSYQPV